MSNLLINNGIIITMNPETPVLYDHALMVQDGKISRICPKSEVKGFAGKEINAAGKVILPGFINVHHHFYSTLVRGLGKAKPSADFNEVLENLWWRLDKQLLTDDIYYSALVSAIDAIRHGTTTIIDHHASPGAITGSLDIITKAILQTGIRANLCYEVSDRDGGSKTLEGIRENVQWLENVQAKNSDYLKGLFGMHAAFTLSDETLETIAAEGDKLNCGYHIHVAEAASDENYNMKRYGKKVVNRLNDFRLLNGKTLAAHCVHIDEEEMEILADKGVAVAHNPQSNLNNSVGIADVVKLAQKGILVGLGTDAMTVNMPEELRVGLWSQHLKHDPSQGFMEISDTLLKNNAIIANRYWDNQLGMIKEGLAADLVLMDYYPPTPLDAGTWRGHVIYGISQAQVDTTICGGKILFQDKQLQLDLDEAEVAAKSRGCALKLWERF
jgi:putative selenium metabolism protein SsnA